MDTPRVAVFGAGGYTGMVLSRLLARHPLVRLALLASERLTQRGAGALDDPAVARAIGGAAYTEDAGLRGCRERGVAVALLCTPAEASLALAPQLLDEGCRVLDLSGAFRLQDAATFEATYGQAHTAPAALSMARYCLPEVTGTGGLGEARLVANPGCYVTAALLALAPLCRRGLLDPAVPIFIDGKSGASGAGRKAQVEYSLCELEGDLRPYRIGRHQHTPEIAAVLRSLGALGEVVFVPHLVGTRRGLLVTCHGRLRPGAGREEARLAAEAFVHDYADAPLVHVVPPEEVSLRRPVGTAEAWVGVHVDPASGGVCAVASLDNLMKGAASQAVQNLNAMLGLPALAGLDSIWSLD